MRIALIAFGLSMLLPLAPLSAQEIRGGVVANEGGSPRVASGAAMTVTCGGGEARGTVQSDGTFSVQTAGGGACRISVTYAGRSSATPLEVHVSGPVTVVNLELVPSDGGWNVRRR